jgi:predicted GIY-YIG superfamily endonuclease
MSGSQSPVHTSHWVAISASSRRGPYYIDAAIDFHTLCKNKNRLMSSLGGADNFKPYNYYQVVWYEECESEQAALARVAEIKALPHAWQRALIQSENLQWLNLETEYIGFPGSVGVVSEFGGTRIRTRAEL